MRTPNGLTIEFQHSPILEEERISREKFYKSIGGMIWVVDGTKNKIDWKRWCNSKLLREHISGVPDDVTISKSASTFLPVEWLHCDVPVFLTLLELPQRQKSYKKRENLFAFFAISLKLFIYLSLLRKIYLLHYAMMVKFLNG